MKPFTANSNYPDVDRDMFGLAFNFVTAANSEAKAEIHRAMERRADELIRAGGFVSRAHYEQMMYNALLGAVKAAEDFISR